MTLKRPDCVFTITVNPVTRIHPCAERITHERAGLFGHVSSVCDACRITSHGYELWGENGMCRGSASNRADLIQRLAYLAKEQWIMRDGRTMGYRFVKGGTLCYIGGTNEN